MAKKLRIVSSKLYLLNKEIIKCTVIQNYLIF